MVTAITAEATALRLSRLRMTIDTSPDRTAARPQARRVSDRYELRQVVGRGGSAEVWMAVDVVLERPVAVKLLYPRPDLDLEKMTERFLREARIAASVRHPNVVEVLDFGVHDGRPFTVLEFLEGESLHQCLTRDPPSATGLARVMIAVLDGLDAVHRAGIVHRDVKPENIFLVPRAGGLWPKLLDFGVSRAGEGAGGRRTTQEGTLIGTPEYMSPEQARGSRALDRRTDIYSAGVLLYEATAGFVPYRADGVGDLIIDIVAGAAPSLAEVCGAPKPLSDLVTKAMRVDPDERFPTAAHMRDALVRLEGKLPRDTPRGRAILPHRSRADRATVHGRGSDPQLAEAVDEAPAVRRQLVVDEETSWTLSGPPTEAPPRATLTASPPSPRGSERASAPASTNGRGPVWMVGLALFAALVAGAWMLASSREDEPPPVAAERRTSAVDEATPPSVEPAEPASPAAEPASPAAEPASPAAEPAPPDAESASPEAESASASALVGAAAESTPARRRPRRSPPPAVTTNPPSEPSAAPSPRRRRRPRQPARQTRVFRDLDY